MVSSSLADPILYNSELDVVMQGNDEAYGANVNGITSNDFTDPLLITEKFEDLDLPVSSPEESPANSLLDSEVLLPPLPRTSYLPTGCCYDDRMKLHANADFSASPHHPEDPRRIEAIMRTLKDADLVFKGPEYELAEILKVSPTRWMYRIAARAATEAEICLVHTAPHFEWVQKLSSLSSNVLRQMTADMDLGRKSLYVGNLTFEAALISAGGAIETCKHVVEGDVKNAIAIIRPPGHHAEHNESLGFCIFNNVPIAAKTCMMDYPETCRKVLILDWDVHHGNGIQNMFYGEPNVLYISIHVYQNGQFYPGQPDDDDIPDGGIDKVGIGKGIGRNVNIGWHDQGMGDGEYMAAFQQVVMPIAQEFEPDLVIVSAGFDAAAGDDLGGCFVTPACYAHMTHMLMSLANGKVAVCLEGGYNLQAISRSALAVAKTLMGEPPEQLRVPPIHKAAVNVLHQVKHHQSQYWDCMRPGVVSLGSVRNAIRLHDMVRSYQRRILSDNHQMVSLHIQREKISRSFDDQVLATPSISTSKKIVIIFHDPPDILATTNQITNQITPENAYLSDPILPYITSLITHDLAIIDVNVPPYITPLHEPTTTTFIPRPSEATLHPQLKDLACYIYDNYILTSAFHPTLFLLGIGDSYLAIKHLLISREECRTRVAGVLSFVSGALRPVKSETDQGLSGWYKANSCIYVSKDHACWSDEESAQRVRKNRFGRVKRSEVDGEEGLAGMMDRYKGEAVEWVVSRLDEKIAEDPDETEEEELGL